VNASSSDEANLVHQLLKPDNLSAYYLSVIDRSFLFPLLNRSPDVSRIRSKMLYATSKDRFQHELDGVHYVIQATDPTEMELAVLRERAN